LIFSKKTFKYIFYKIVKNRKESLFFILKGAKILRKSKFFWLYLILIVSPFLIATSSAAIDPIGTDNEVIDSANDVYINTGKWRFVCTSRGCAWTQAWSQTNKYPYLDMRKLTIATSGSNYVVTLELGAPYNQTAFSEDYPESTIEIFLYVNGSDKGDSTEYYISLHRRHTGDRLQINTIPYPKSSETWVNAYNTGNDIVFEFSQSLPSEWFDNVENDISKWKVYAEIKYVYGESWNGEFYLDVLNYPEADEFYSSPGLIGEQEPAVISILGFTIILLIILVVIATVFLIIRRKKRKKKEPDAEKEKDAEAIKKTNNT